MVVTIIGAGLTGSMLAILLAEYGEEIIIMEKRTQKPEDEFTDCRETAHLVNPNKRSINLALSFRGIVALKKAGLFEKVQPLLVPMEGRCVHPLNGFPNVQPYGHKGQAIYSVARSDMNSFLLEQLKSLKNVSIRFGCISKRVSSDGEIVFTQNGQRQTLLSDLIIGTDGAFSSVRDSLMKCSRINVEHHSLSVGYKEFILPARPDGSYALPYPNALHVWPRHALGMLVALPNFDGSFTCTLFIPWDGPRGLDALDKASDEHVHRYFQEQFPDVCDIVPDLIDQFRSSPSSPLLTVKTNPWNWGKVVLLGDAAHAVVPFYGQGMNAGFEDALIFQEIWEEQKGDIPKIVHEFNRRRQPGGIALADLSLMNFYEMSSLTICTTFRWKKRLECALSRYLPTLWIPLYTMVSFTRMPYDKAIRRASLQDKFLYSLLTSCSLLLSVSVGALVLRYRHNMFRK